MVNTEILNWLILPLLIFAARILDVTLGTMRIIYVSKGLKYLAPLVGFFEVIIWLLAIRVIMQNLNNVVCFLAYGAGFAMGNYVGLYVERKLAVGKLLIRVITQQDSVELIKLLRSKGFGVTNIDAQGAEGKVQILYVIIKRQDYGKVAEAIQRFNPKSFFTVSDAGWVSQGIFPPKQPRLPVGPFIGTFKFWRKGK